MTQALSGIVLAGVVAACWVLGRPKRNILRSADASAIAAINRGQMELVIPAGTGDAKGQTSGQSVQLPAAHDRRGRSSAPVAAAQPLKLPRNVSRMR